MGEASGRDERTKYATADYESPSSLYQQIENLEKQVARLKKENEKLRFKRDVITNKQSS
jgi:cell division protein FtsB